MSYQLNQATSILATGSTEAFQNQQAEKQGTVDHSRVEGQFDFVAAVTSALMAAEIDTSNFSNNASILDAQQNLSTNAQRFTVNRFFRHQMMSVRGVDSIYERTNLIEDGEYSDWIRLFQTAVVPFLKTHNLPKNLF